jgi:adenylate cyclase
MGEAASLRKLTAVLAADVAGYSRMMRADQHGTIDKLTVRREILDDAVARHQGRIVNTAGDSVLAEFGSVVDALHCALEIQTSVAQENQRLPRDRHMSFRIGVHTGEVFVRGSDLLGDGVNVAARLQSLAPPGGIYASAVVREQVRGILSLQFQNKGQRRLKNIDQPVRVFAVSSAAPGKPVRPDRSGRRASAARVAAVLALCLVAASAGSVWRAHPSWLEAWLPDSGAKQGQPVVAASTLAPRGPRAAVAASPPSAAKSPNTQPAATNTASATSPSDTIELALWQSATAQGTQSAFEEYLRQYPSGHFAELARARIEGLKPPPPSETVAVAPARVPDASAQLAAGIPFECPKSGTIIAFSDGQRLTFGKRDGFRCRAVASNGKETDEFAGFVSLSTLPSLGAEDLQKFWPLKENAELSFSTRTPELFSGQIAQAWVSNRYRVVGTERVHVPAGDFDTVIVERQFLSHASAIFDSVDVTQRIWYAPKLGYIVKLVSERGTSIYLPAALPAHVEATEVTVP